MSFSSATQAWFDGTFEQPTKVQQLGWQTIATGAHALLVAPTGSGKTLAAFLAAIDRLSAEKKQTGQGTSVLYLSPLKALAYDVERNLRAPLVGIAQAAAHLNETTRPIDVAIRTGDTPQRERQRQLRSPADILVTTPESLFLILGSKARANLATVHTVIVDEIHAMAGSKRGTHLSLSLERLENLTHQKPQRIGLSATVRPLDEIASFLGGTRPVEVIDASQAPTIEVDVVVPVPDMERAQPVTSSPDGGSILAELYTREAGKPHQEKGIWPVIYPELLARIKAHRSTIVFVNSRGLCERLTQRLNDLAEEELVLAHHGSVSHEKRSQMENALKAGELKAIVATSSLELGIDMGAVDLVLMVESPGSVARGLQRVGRAGHGVGEVSKGQLFPKFKGDLLESAVVTKRMLKGQIEAISIPKNPLDVLAQQVVAMCCDSPMQVSEIEDTVKRAYPYRSLSPALLNATLDMLSGRYPSTDFADLRPLLSWDRTHDRLTARRGAPMVSRMNAGTIPDRGQYTVHLGEDGPKLGELDEEMVFESRAGDNILLGASTWRVEQITRDRVLVSPAPGEPGRLPFWKGDGPGRPLELGRELGAFVRKVGDQPPAKRKQWLMQNAPLDAHAAGNLDQYISQQQSHTGTLPTDKAITVERFRDELGDWRVCLLSPFGSRVHAPWAMVLQQELSVQNGFEVQTMYTDDGIVLRFADAEELPDLTRLLPDPEALEDALTTQLSKTAMFAGLFRENAARSLLLPRRRVNARNPLWAQRIKSQNLLATVEKYPSFPMVLETYRQALKDVFDLDGLKNVLAAIRSRELRVDEVETTQASPFSKSLVFAYVAAYLYEGDAPLAERKAQALTLDRSLLAELLGQAELRELIDLEVLISLEEELQCLTPQRQARNADELHDTLRKLGDLTDAQVGARTTENARPWLDTLAEQRRAFTARVAGEPRWIAIEHAALYRDALGTALPSGLPDTLLQPVPQALKALLQLYAKGRGPFLAREPAERFGLPASHIQLALAAAEQEGDLVHGEIRPGGSTLDWCDANNLVRLKRRTLAKLRNQVAPVQAQVLCQFLMQWQGINSGRRGEEALLECIGQLQGLPLPWSVLSSGILNVRIADFSHELLDRLAATGQIVWVGSSALGPRDGRIRLFLREQVSALLDTHPGSSDDRLAMAVDATLEAQGASFYMELEAGVRTRIPDIEKRELEATVWDMVWDGKLTNDTFGPLRALTQPRRGRGRFTQSRLSGGRWTLVRNLQASAIDDTRKTLAHANLLLERYGVVSRDAVAHEQLRGGFGPLYRTFKAMEESGQIRRGYFVEGMAGAQFGHVGAIDRLRAAKTSSEENPFSSETAFLAAIDPANPYGSLLPWPATPLADKARLRRVAGAWLILVNGMPFVYVTAKGKKVFTFGAFVREYPEGISLAFGAMRALPRGTRRGSLIVEEVDGEPASQSTYAKDLLLAGFERDHRGLVAVVT